MQVGTESDLMVQASGAVRRSSGCCDSGDNGQVIADAGVESPCARIPDNNRTAACTWSPRGSDALHTPRLTAPVAGCSSETAGFIRICGCGRGAELHSAAGPGGVRAAGALMKGAAGVHWAHWLQRMRLPLAALHGGILAFKRCCQRALSGSTRCVSSRCSCTPSGLS